MKSMGSPLTYLFAEQQAKQNLRALLKFFLLLAGIVLFYSAIFHILMALEGQRHSWLTGLYWTLTVMSTLGFGDITFQSDAGRAFSVLVLVSGIVLLLIVLPFAFIRFFYAPWLEAQIRSSAPRQVPKNLEDHLILCHFNPATQGLIARLEENKDPYVVIEPDMARAAQLHSEGVRVIVGDLDHKETYEAANASKARLLFANRDEVTNTNITLTALEAAPFLAVAALVESPDAIDVLELSGAAQVLPLKQRLGEQLAARVVAGEGSGQIIGEFEGVFIAEFPVHNTELAGKSIRETKLRERFGVSVVAYWERAHLQPASPSAVLGEFSVIVVAGTEKQIRELNKFLHRPGTEDCPVLVLGGGKVGRAAARALARRGVQVHIVERVPERSLKLDAVGAKVFYGDASDLQVLEDAGIRETRSVVLTTNDDAMNIFLALYCSRLNPEARIVSRITHERNLESIHRAGASFVLSYARLSMQSVLALYQQRDLVIVGEEVELFWVPVPRSLEGMTLAQSAIGEQTGLNVIGVRDQDGLAVSPRGSTTLEEGAELIVAGTPAQRKSFENNFSVASTFATGMPIGKARRQAEKRRT